MTEATEQSVLYLCPKCNTECAFSHTDDLGTSFYRCKSCGEITSTPTVAPYKPSMYSTIESFQEGNGAFNPARFGKDILDNYYLKTMRDNETVFRYDVAKGIYTPDGEVFLKEKMAETLKLETRQHDYPDVVFYVKAKTYTDRPKASIKIALQNGLLNVKTGEVTVFTPVEFITTRLPLAYDQNAECSKILKFLSEILEPDQIPIVQELLGYCLLREYPLNTCFVLLGIGANGKSTLLNLLEAFLGPENCSHATLQQLCEGKFELAQLYGKLANICDDLPGDALKSVGNFKNLTGNASIQGQFKFKNPFDFLNTAKLVFACNKLPAAPEDTIAYYRRFIILNFNKMFIGLDADPYLIKKLNTPSELSGLLNWALKGLQRLLKNRQFTAAQSIEKTRSQYIRTADSCQSFLEEMTEITQNDDDYIREDTLYRAYCDYCTIFKLPKKRKADLTISIQKNRSEAQKTQIRLGRERPRVWQYLKLKENVTAVTTVTGVSIYSNSENFIFIKGTSPVTGVTAVTPSQQQESQNKDESEKICGHCAIWHKPSCSYPDGDSSCVAPTNRYAVDCRNYLPVEVVP